MDCLGFLRARSAPLRRSAVTLTGAWLAAAGCTTVKQDTLPAEPTVTVVAKLDKEKAKPRRLPKPATCVTMGDYLEQATADPKCTPADQERLHDEALRAYQQAIKSDSTCAAAYVGLGRLYQKIEEYDKAVATYNAGLQASPKCAQLWYELGMCHARRKAWEPALANLRNASELEPDNHFYLNMLGFCLARAGQFDESYRYFAKVQGEAKAHYNVARMLHHVQRDGECRQHLALVLKARPDCEPALQLLAEVDGAAAGQAIQPVSAEESVDEAARKLGGKGKDENEWE